MWNIEKYSEKRSRPSDHGIVLHLETVDDPPDIKKKI